MLSSIIIALFIECDQEDCEILSRVQLKNILNKHAGSANQLSSVKSVLAVIPDYELNLIDEQIKQHYLKLNITVTHDDIMIISFGRKCPLLLRKSRIGRIDKNTNVSDRNPRHRRLRLLRVDMPKRPWLNTQPAAICKSNPFIIRSINFITTV